VAVSLLVLAVSTVLAVIGALHTGITTDEPIHVMRLRNYFDTGWYALDWDYGGAGPGGDDTNTFVYAPVAMLVLHAWSVLWGAEGWHDVATSSHAYDVRHLGVVMIGLVGLGAVAALGRLVLHHWRWGLVAAAALAAVPMWTGHEMFNVKDVPVATGYTMATLGLVGFVRRDRAGPGLRLARSGCLVAGLVLTLGTRPGMWSGLLAVLVIAALGVVLASSTRALGTGALAELAAACGVAAGALVAVYPNLFGSPLRALPRTTESSSSFLSGAKQDRFYVPGHVLEEMPTLLLAFVVLGVVLGATTMWKQWRTDPVPAVRIGLVGVQAVTLPVVAIVLGSDLYHGLRQLLFAAPAAVVLAAYGMAWLLERPAPDRAQVWGGRLWALGAAAALLLPTADQITLQPYQTTYVNLATDLVSAPFVDAEGRAGSDYWRVSLPELIEDETLDRDLVCKPTVDQESDIAHPFTNAAEAFSTSRSLDCRDEVNGPLRPLHLPVHRGLVDAEYDAVFLRSLPDNCTPLDRVTRERHGFEVVLTTLGRCTVDPPDLTDQGVWSDSPLLGTAAAGDLWLFAVAGWQQWPGSPELTSPVPLAEVAFRPTRACRESGCTLVVHGSGPEDLVAHLAGAEVPVSRTSEGDLLVPITADRADHDDGVWVRFTRRTGGTLGMRLTGLSLSEPTEGLG
jgi:hypothetical protein